VQGIAVDRVKGHIYFSFTTVLVKTDLWGNLLGTVRGLTGHLGDLTFDPGSRMVLGSLEYKAAGAFYIAMFAADAITTPDRDASDPRVMRTVHLAEVAEDFGSPSSVHGPGPDTPGRYGCSGIDGIAIGPDFRDRRSRRVTVAYGVYSGADRADNDHQILLQFSPRGWWDRLARPLVEAAPHRSGPRRAAGKYFVRTGNTTFGVQNLEYDAQLDRWFLGVYAGRKPAFPNFTLFALDGRARPRRRVLGGLGGERGAELPLADVGLLDSATGIRGWHQKADVGIASLGDGLFYLSSDGARNGLQTSDLALSRWSGDPARPFVPVDARNGRPTPAPIR
jgi:hypothetical protein